MPPPRLILPIIAVLSLLLALLTNFRTIDLDVFHEMALAREFLGTGRFPYHDFSSFAATVDPVIHHEWLTGVILYGVANLGGATGFIAFKYALVAGIVVLAVRAARLRGARLGVLCTLAPLAIILGCHGLTTIRAQVFTLLFSAALLTILPSIRYEVPGAKTRVFLWFLPLQLLWQNIHAGFVVGLGILLIEQIAPSTAAPVRSPDATPPAPHALLLRYLVPLALAAFIIPLNPYSFAILEYLFRGLTLDRSLIAEWGPYWTAPPLLLAIFALSLLLIAYAVIRRGWRNLGGLFLLAVSAILAIMHARHASLYALFWFIFVPAWLEPTPLGTQIAAVFARRSRVIAAGSAIIAATALAIAFARHPFQLVIPTRYDPQQPNAIVYPVGAVEYLCVNHFRGNLMTPYNAGSYVSWHLLPEVKVGLDSRYEVAYDPQYVLAIHRMYAGGAGWEKTLEASRATLILIPVHGPLAKQGARLEAMGWRLVYEDDAYELRASGDAGLPRVDARGKGLPVAVFP